MLSFIFSAILAAPLGPAARLLADPTQVRSAVDGVDAVGIDPAAPVAAEGPELQAQTRVAGSQQGGTRWGVAAALPFTDALAVYGGYAWLTLPNARVQRLTLGSAAWLTPRLAVGTSYQFFTDADGGGPRANVWNLGLLWRPAAWLSASLGVDNVNQPRFGGLTLERALRLGGAVRPWLGALWLTLGAEARIHSRAGDLDLDQSRLLVDVAPLEGLHLRAAYLPGREELWAGVAFHLIGAELRAAAPASGASPRASGGSFTLTLRGVPTESWVEPTGLTVVVPLRGELIAQPDSILAIPDLISDVPLRLSRLAEDPSVANVVLVISELDVGLATVEELRAAVTRLRTAGKRVTAELIAPREKEYLVAAAADVVRLDPATNLVIDGFSVTQLFFADALARLGIRFDAVAIGRYKTGPDPLVRSEPRPEEREVIEDILSRSFELLVQALRRDRGLEVDTVERILNQGLFTPEAAREIGLVDELSQPTDLTALPRFAQLGEALPPRTPPQERWGPLPVIAVVPIVGNIVADAEAPLLPGESASARFVIAALEEARRDDDVAAVVLRIDSPGGEVFASELIWRAVRQLAEVKPVVVSMGSVAASGGYYVAVPAHAILAESTTLTGSIGIFTVLPDLSGLLEATGINSEIYRVGPFADWDSPLRGITEEERAKIRRGLEVAYEAFLARVAAGRNMDVSAVRELAEGRVYTGEQALRLGLVDALGGLTEAIDEAKARAGIAPERPTQVRIPKPPLRLPTTWVDLVAARAPLLSLIDDAQRAARRLHGRPLALLPYRLEVEP